MKKIVILTASRAEFGLLKPLILKFEEDAEFDMKLAVTGMHLSPEFGMTVNEIVSEGIPIDKKIEILLSSDTPTAVSKSMGLAMIGFADYFEELKPDALIVLGDRYETLAVCIAAMNKQIPIFHLRGGETTEGAVDEAIRHAITKMSYLHFAGTEEYRHRIIQLGEAPERVFNVGTLAVENCLNMDLMDFAELKNSLGLPLKEKYAVGTFHPVTLEESTAEIQTRELCKAISQFPKIDFLFTGSNADAGGRIINKLLSEYHRGNKNFYYVESLGLKRYLSALKHSLFVIGNSSSGLVEAPSFGIPTINIGDRQKGRIAGKTVIHCIPKSEEICNAIDRAVSLDFLKGIRFENNPYGDGNASLKILEIVRDFLLNDKVNIKKKFYDVAFTDL